MTFSIRARCFCGTLLFFAIFFISFSVSAQKKFVALGVVISKYEGNADINGNLDNAASGLLSAFRNLARYSGYADIEIDVIDSQSSPDIMDVDKFVEKVVEYAEKVKDPDDIFVFYFTGHGFFDEHEVTQKLLLNTEERLAHNQAVGLNYIASEIKKKANDALKLIFVDACANLSGWSDKWKTSFNKSVWELSIESLMKDEEKYSPVSIFVSAEVGEKAGIDKEEKMGFYTKHFVNAFSYQFNSKDKKREDKKWKHKEHKHKLAVGELGLYLNKALLKYEDKLSSQKKQTPRLFSNEKQKSRDLYVFNEFSHFSISVLSFPDCSGEVCSYPEVEDKALGIDNNFIEAINEVILNEHNEYGHNGRRILHDSMFPQNFTRLTSLRITDSDNMLDEIAEHIKSNKRNWSVFEEKSKLNRLDYLIVLGVSRVTKTFDLDANSYLYRLTWIVFENDGNAFLYSKDKTYNLNKAIKNLYGYEELLAESARNRNFSWIANITKVIPELENKFISTYCFVYESGDNNRSKKRIITNWVTSKISENLMSSPLAFQHGYIVKGFNYDSAMKNCSKPNVWDVKTDLKPHVRIEGKSDSGGEFSVCLNRCYNIAGKAENRADHIVKVMSDTIVDKWGEFSEKGADLSRCRAEPSVSLSCSDFVSRDETSKGSSL